MSQAGHPAPYFQSGSPLTDEYLASYTFLNGTKLPYPGMLGQISEFQAGTPGAWNLLTVQLVKAATSITPALGDLLYWSDKTIWEVTTTVTGQQIAGFAPVLMAGAASYFWAILKGDCTVHVLDSPTNAAAAGTFCIASSTSGRTNAVTAAATIAQAPVLGRHLAAEFASHYARARVNVMGI